MCYRRPSTQPRRRPGPIHQETAGDNECRSLTQVTNSDYRHRNLMALTAPASKWCRDRHYIERFGNITRAMGAPSLMPRLTAVVRIGMVFLTNIRLTATASWVSRAAQAWGPREQRVNRLMSRNG